VGEDGKPISRKLRGRLLCDQKANSIADIAAAIKGVVEAEGNEEGKVEGEIVVRWKDVFDAEFAESWPEGVVHDKLVVGKNNRRVVEFEAETEEGVEGREIEGEQKRVRL
jgi:nicotinamide mononucleotide (NMN) deamidase PncC